MNANNEDCFLKILASSTKPLRTSEILKATDKFPDLCSGCKSGTDVIIAGMRLLKKGKIKREVASGGFRWSLL